MKRLKARGHKACLVTHIVAAGAWIGIDVVLAVLVFTAMLTSDPSLAAVCYQALRVFAVWPLLITGLVCLGSGVVLGLGTRYGLVRYWWVAVKLVLNIVLTTLGLVALRPAVGEAAAYGQSLLAGLPAGPAPNLVFPPIVSPVCLLIAVLLSVYKPGGRIRRRTPRHASAGSRITVRGTPFNAGDFSRDDQTSRSRNPRNSSASAVVPKSRSTTT